MSMTLYLMTTFKYIYIGHVNDFIFNDDNYILKYVIDMKLYILT